MVTIMTERISPLRMGEQANKNQTHPWSVQKLDFNPLAEPWRTNENKRVRPLDIGLYLANGGTG